MSANKVNQWGLGICIVIGLSLLGYLLGQAAINVKLLDRSVTVKGLAEKEFPADIVIWPIQFTVANNDLTELYQALESNTDKIRQFLESSGIQGNEITLSAPTIFDKSAQQYGNQAAAPFRYTASQVVTVYSQNIDLVRAVIPRLSELGKQGIVISGGDYQTRVEYLFTGLNDIKPTMIEEATRQAREVAEKFAADSSSRLGKIKTASQGQFTISDRDKNNPHIKRIRVVSTVIYYLSD
jgi:hypothetical protein